MRIFFNQFDSSMYVIPYRSGSTFIKNISDDHGLLFLETNHFMQMEIFKVIKSQPKNKILFYRDPFEKFISYYNRFIFKKDKIEHNFLKDIYDETDTGVEVLSIWHDIVLRLQYLEENLQKDEHTRPISKYFETHDEDVYEYDIIDVSQFSKFWSLRGKPPIIDPNNSSTYESITSRLEITFKDLPHIFKIKDWINTVYANDYKLGNQVTTI